MQNINIQHDVSSYFVDFRSQTFFTLIYIKRDFPAKTKLHLLSIAATPVTKIYCMDPIWTGASSGLALLRLSTQKPKQLTYVN